MLISHALILGIVEGITEFLPVSSTGHLIIANALLGMRQTDALKTFDVAIQLGAILAIVVLYWQRIRADGPYMRKVLVACLPTLLLGALLYPFIKTYLLGNSTIVLIALVLGGLVILATERYWVSEEYNTIEEPSYKQAIAIGCFQIFSFIPGASRAAATIVGGLMLGIRRKAIVEFSFLLAIPTMIAAVGYDALHAYKDIVQIGWDIFFVGFFAAGVTAYATVKYFIRYIQHHDLKIFGWYRIVAALVLFVLLFVLQ